MNDSVLSHNQRFLVFDFGSITDPVPDHRKYIRESKVNFYCTHLFSDMYFVSAISAMPSKTMPHIASGFLNTESSDAVSGIVFWSHVCTYDDLGLGQLSNRNRKLKIAGCVTERYHSFARDFDILRSISKMSFLNITHQHTPTRLFYSAHWH